jgi:hypothetical protein
MWQLTEYQSANLTVSKVLEAVETLDHKMNSTIALNQKGFTSPPQLQSTNSSTGSSSSMTSKPSTSIMMELLQLMRDMRKDFSGQNEIVGNKPINRRDRKNISKYCWSHGHAHMQALIVNTKRLSIKMQHPLQIR